MAKGKQATRRVPYVNSEDCRKTDSLEVSGPVEDSAGRIISTSADRTDTSVDEIASSIYLGRVKSGRTGGVDVGYPSYTV